MYSLPCCCQSKCCYICTATRW